MATWTVEVDFGAGFQDISEHCRDVHRERRSHNDLRPTINSASFSCTDLATANLFLAAGADMDVRIRKDSADWFIGLVRTSFESTVRAGLDRIGVECVDRSIDLQARIDESFVFSDYKVCDTAATSQSIVHQLLTKAGISLGLASLTTIDVTVTRYSIERSERKTFWGEISDLLFEYGYTLDVRPDGVFVMREMHPAALGSPPALTDADMGHPLKITRRRERYEGFRVQWYAVRTFTDHMVFSDRTGGNETNPANIAVGNGEYYPEGASASDDVWSVYQIPDAEILDVANEELIWQSDGDVSLDTQSWGSKRANIKFLGGSPSGGTITRFEIRGDATIRDKTNRRLSVVYNVVGTDRLLEVQTRFIEARSYADNLADNLANYYDASKFLWAFGVDPDLTIDVHDYFAADSAAHNRSAIIRVVELREDERGTRYAVCEEIDTYVAHTVDVQDVLESGLAAMARMESRLNEPEVVVAASAYTGAYNYRCTGANDHLVVQQALDDGHRRIRLTAGTYTFGGKVTVPADTEIVGAGASTAIEKNGVFELFEIAGSEGDEKPNVAFRDMLLRSLDTAGIELIDADFADNLLIDHVRFEDINWFGVFIDDSAGVIVHGCTCVDCRHGPGLLDTTGIVSECEIFWTGGDQADSMQGITLRGTGAVVVVNNHIHDIVGVATTTLIVGIRCEGQSRESLIEANVVEDLYYFGGGSGAVIGIDLGTDSTSVRAGNNTVRRCLGYDSAWADSDKRQEGIGILNWSSDHVEIVANDVRNCGQGIMIQGISATRTVLLGNNLQDCGQLIDRASCESTTPPSNAGDTTVTTSHATFVRSSTPDRGTFSYKYDKTSDTTWSSAVYLQPNISTIDMHDLLPGVEYTMVARVKVPAGTIPGEVKILIMHYSGSWVSTAAAATLNDEWETLAVTHTIAVDATGTARVLRIDTGEDANAEFYVDNIRFYPAGIDNQHENLVEDNGTGTIAA